MKKMKEKRLLTEKVVNRLRRSISLLSLMSLLLLLALLNSGIKANNLRITNVVNTNPGAANPQLSFVISWDNSWYVNDGTDDIWDAVWVFVKYQTINTGSATCDQNQVWQHANVSSNANDFAIGYPLQIDRPSDRKGVYIRRANPGTGTVQPTTAIITLDIPVAGTYNFYVLGIEMCYIPSGSFNLGDEGITGYGTTTLTFKNLNVTSEAAIVTTDIGGGIQNNIPAAYPKGYDAFYCMKYEISQWQYAEFLNLLSYDQQAARTMAYAPPNSDPDLTGVCAMDTSCRNRNSIKIIQKGINNTRAAVYGVDLAPAPGDPFNSSNDGGGIAMNYLKWDDLLAYLDWACLAPMTNLQFEKIARGKQARIANEYIWGNTLITQAISNSLQASTDGTPTEQSTSVGNEGLCAYNASAASTTLGPLRNGFAATSTSTRSQAAAAYYGVQNLGGNVWEMVMGGSNYNNNGYKLTTTDVGNGGLTAAGETDVLNWLYGNNAYTLNGGCYYWHFEMRGGSYCSAAETVRTSDRSKNMTLCGGIAPFGYGGAISSAIRQKDVGGRGVRPIN